MNKQKGSSLIIVVVFVALLSAGAVAIGIMNNTNVKKNDNIAMDIVYEAESERHAVNFHRNMLIINKARRSNQTNTNILIPREFYPTPRPSGYVNYAYYSRLLSILNENIGTVSNFDSRSFQVMRCEEPDSFTTRGGLDVDFGDAYTILNNPSLTSIPSDLIDVPIIGRCIPAMDSNNELVSNYRVRLYITSFTERNMISNGCYELDPYSVILEYELRGREFDLVNWRNVRYYDYPKFCQ